MRYVEQSPQEHSQLHRDETADSWRPPPSLSLSLSLLACLSQYVWRRGGVFTDNPQLTCTAPDQHDQQDWSLSVKISLSIIFLKSPSCLVWSVTLLVALTPLQQGNPSCVVMVRPCFASNVMKRLDDAVKARSFPASPLLTTR